MSLAAARVLLVGLGGLGCPAAIALARAGVGTLGLADDDLVDPTNLHRQILFGERDVFQPKVAAAAAALRTIAPSIAIEEHATRLLPHNAADLAARYDLVIEGSDNFPTKFLAADACFLARRPIVHGAAVRWHGTALAVGASGGPCYRCVFEDVPLDRAPNCEDAGVVGAVVGVIAAAQADLALSILAGDDVSGELFTFDGASLTTRRRKIQKRASCTLCGTRTIHDTTAARYAPVSCEL